MSKKIITIIIAVMVFTIGVIGLMFFNSDKKEENNTNTTSSTTTSTTTTNIDNSDNNSNEDNKNDNQTSNKKIAVIYFSASGTTKTVAEYIKDETKGDLIEIVPKEKYTDADLNYNNDDCRANKEQNDSSARPVIANNINTDSYDVIYLGYPIWWGTMPKIILTFLDSHDLSGKTVISFCTSGGSGIETSVSYFKSNYKSVNWLDGKRLSTSKSEVTNWISGLKY